MDELFGPVFGTGAVDGVLGARAWVRTLCAVEAALARACARAGLVGLEAAAAVGAAAAGLGESLDPAELGAAAAAGGNPVIPLVTLLRAAVGEQHDEAVHPGATSQDVLDTALMLLARDALALVRADVAACADLAADLAARHRGTAMAGRTLLQVAEPTTFGLLAAGWGAGLDAAADRLAALAAALPVQLGGAAGTRAVWHPHGAAVAAALAVELGLADPGGVWHAGRTVVADLAAGLGVCGVAIAKPATDVVLLAQTGIEEVREAAPGGSSSMPHKQNPVAAVTARAGAAQLPGLVATVLAAGGHELQRAAGGWHAEWPALSALLRAAGGAAARLRTSLTGLHVDTAAMARNLGRAAASDGPELAAAGELVDRYLLGRTP